MFDKLTILEGEWLGREYYSNILPQLNQKNIPTAHSQIIPLTKLHDKEYWGALRSSHNIDIASLDHRHWFYEDDIFEQYVDKIASVSFPAVCMFDCPFGYEMPNANLVAFEKKLYERSKILSDALRARQEKTTIISPAISMVNLEHQDTYLSYFVHNRTLFDVYGMHICYDMRETLTGILTAFLNQVLGVVRKPVWITKWAIPSLQQPIDNLETLSSSVWKPMIYSEAARKLTHTFQVIEEITQGNSKWLYAGMGLDAYNRYSTGPSSFWDQYPLYRFNATKFGWDFYHFMGTMTHDGHIKRPILDAVMELADANNRM